MSALDVEKFRKVHGLMTGGATQGEKEAAQARARAMAKKAGMTLDQAVASLNGPTTARPEVFDFGASFDDHMEQKYPGWKAEEAQKRHQRSERDALRRRDILNDYGSIANIFARQPDEEALAAALKPFVTKWGEWMDEVGRWHRFAETIQGNKKPMCFWGKEDVSIEVREAIAHGVPWPASLAVALTEVQKWDRLRLDRGLVQGHEWEHYPEVEIRVSLLEGALNGERPAASWDDVQARFDWKRHEFRRQWLDPQELDDPFMHRLEADIAALRTNASADIPVAARPVAERRGAGETMAAYVARFFCGFPHPNGSEKQP